MVAIRQIDCYSCLRLEYVHASALPPHSSELSFVSPSHDEKVLCKAWVPSDEGKNKFFEKMGFSPIDRHEKPWSHVEFECLGCGRSDGCVCSGVVYAKT